MNILHLSHAFDGIVFSGSEPQMGHHYFGANKLLNWLEQCMGLSGYPNNTDYLRIELYRQALGQHLASVQDSHSPFFQKSFEADRFAAAAVLMDWRDELVLAGWTFEVQDNMPPRLYTLAIVEQLFAQKTGDSDYKVLAMGYADRFKQALETLKATSLPIAEIHLYEPIDLQLPQVRNFLHICADQFQIPIQVVAPQAKADEHTDLGILQQRLLHPEKIMEPSPARNDTSLVILKSTRDSDAAVSLAQLIRENKDLQPFFLVPEMDLILEQALLQEGFPAMGILSSSLARPSLQVLKLAPAFLWEPVDVFKLMEFLTLPLKPLDHGLSLEIARVLADKPGLFNDNWFAAVYGYIEKSGAPDEIREFYEFWFDRRRYPIDKTAPKRDAIAIYGYLHEWASVYYEEMGSTNTSLLVLSEQARRIRDLLEALPEQRISFLELERIVRTIYEPSPVQFEPAAVQCFQYVHQPGAVAKPTETTVWWNCLYDNIVPTPDKWQQEERNYLSTQGIALLTTRETCQRSLLLQLRPILQCSERLILIIPDQMNGQETVSHLILGDIEASFGSSIKDFTYLLNTLEGAQRLSEIWNMPEADHLPIRLNKRPKPNIQIENTAWIEESPYETPTNLERLFYYPHQWFFRQKARLFPSNLLSIGNEITLLGNLAHRFFEALMQEPIYDLDRNAVKAWVDKTAETLLPKEGATLLLYGREPERMSFLNKVKNAAWSLISLIKSNHWQVLHTELDLEGHFVDVPIRGKADLVLQRGDELAIVDLKWSGTNHRKELIQNSEDLQLILYAKLLPPPTYWPHTAYFILSEGKMIARNNLAFKEAMIAGKFDDHAGACQAIFEKMEKTYLWRREQLLKGTLEMRNTRTIIELESIYEGQLFELLEMKSLDAKWDEYGLLLL